MSTSKEGTENRRSRIALMLLVLTLSIGVSAGVAFAGLPNQASNTVSSPPAQDKGKVNPASDGLEQLPAGQQAISYSTLKMMGKVNPVELNAQVDPNARYNNPNSVVTWGPDQNTSLGISANEPAAVMHPSSPMHALVSGNFPIDNTTDGGATWQSRNPPMPSSSGDTVVAWAPTSPNQDWANTVALASGGGTIQLHQGRSTDRGVTWQNFPTNVNTPGFFNDREYLWADEDPASPFYGRTYLTETLFDPGGTGSVNTTATKWSSDNGVTWSTAFMHSNPSAINTLGNRQFGSMAFQPGGAVVHGWMEAICCGGNPSFGTNNRYKWARSTDGGVTWPVSGTVASDTRPESVSFNSNGPAGFRWSPQSTIAANPVNGTLYTTWLKFRNPGTPQGTGAAVAIARSTDNGATWSVPTFVYNDPNTTVTQYMPWVVVSRDGVVHVTYTSSLAGAPSTLAHFYTQSTDNGVTWSAPFQLSTVTYSSASFMGDYQATHVGSYGSNGSIIASWTDNRAGQGLRHHARIGTFVQGTPTPTVTGTPPTATRTNTAPTATATACAANAVLTGSLDAGDPDFTRPNTFQQGQTCTQNGVHNYDVYTLQTSGGTVTASTCGGATWDTYLILYQSPNGAPIPGFVPSGCTNAIAANDDACGLQSTVTANLVAGTYYVVVSEFSTPGGAYTVNVTAPGACGTPATATGTSTPGGPSATATTCVPSGGAWTPAANTPANIARYGFAQNGNDFYVISGVSSGMIVNTLYRYNTGTGVWTTLAPIPTGGEAPAAAYFNGKIYVGGGYVSGAASTLFQIYDIASNTWTAGPAMPSPTWGAAAGAFNNKVYVAGGNFPATTTLRIYDIPTNTWSTGTAMPSAYILGGYNMVGQHLYVIGSYGSSPSDIQLGNPALTASDGKLDAQVPNANSTVSQRLDMTAGTWTTGPVWTQGRADMALSTDGTKIYAIAGDTTGGGYFDPSLLVDELAIGTWPSGTWVASPPNLPSTPRQGNQAGFSSAGAIWSTGGITSGAVFINQHTFRTAGGGCPSPTVTATGGVATATSTRTATSGATATCVPQAAGWVPGAPLPTTRVRAVGVYYPDNGRFYVMGGRSADPAGNEVRNPTEYNPATNTWTAKSAMYGSAQINNMVGGVLNVGGTNMIVTVGGSAGGGTAATGEVRTYNPVTDVMTVVTSDPWLDGTNNILPGGSAVVNNKMYVLGGFEINVGMSNKIWEYDPARAAGARWVLKAAVLPTPLGYIPTTAIGGMIYTGGGSDFSTGALEDTVFTYRYDPATDTICDPCVANMPNATGETDAVTMNGTEMWVLGGGRIAPNPSNMVQVYNSVSNTWSMGPSFTTARRNFPVDTDGMGRIYLAGGYAPTAPTDNMEIYRPAIPCGTSTPTTVASATRTNTAIVPTNTNTAVVPPTSTSTATTPPVATATVCVMPFTDVDIYNPFYIYIKCLYCRGIISGYADNTFRPYNDITRGQTAKIVSNSAGFSEPVSGQRYTDVPTTHTFYVWIMRLTNRNIATGYNTLAECPTGVPCFRPENPVTRGQLAKMASNAAGFSDVPPAGTLTFTDVPPGSTFYLFIERLARRGIINGYPCGVNPEEPCDAQRRPYYRPNHNITRGQASKIVANTFFPVNCTPGTPAILPGR